MVLSLKRWNQILHLVSELSHYFQGLDLSQVVPGGSRPPLRPNPPLVEANSGSSSSGLGPCLLQAQLLLRRSLGLGGRENRGDSMVCSHCAKLPENRCCYFSFFPFLSLRHSRLCVLVTLSSHKRQLPYQGGWTNRV